MNKLYYGSGRCTIETSQIVGLQISYRGNIKIDDKTEQSHALMANGKMIIIFPISKMNVLSELFEYSGEFRILSVIASDSSSNRIPVQIKKQMHFSELMDTNAEDLTLKTKELNAGYRYKNKLKKTTVIQTTIDNLHSNGELYLKDEPYRGSYHIHKETGQAMTGATHTQDSVNLQVKKLKDKKWRINK